MVAWLKRVWAWLVPAMPTSDRIERDIERLLSRIDELHHLGLDALARERQERIDEINALSRRIGELDGWLAQAERRAERLQVLARVMRDGWDERV